MAQRFAGIFADGEDTGGLQTGLRARNLFDNADKLTRSVPAVDSLGLEGSPWSHHNS